MRPILYPPYSSKESNTDLVAHSQVHSVAHPQLFKVLSLSTWHIQITPFHWKITLIWPSTSTCYLVPTVFISENTLKFFTPTSEEMYSFTPQKTVIKIFYFATHWKPFLVHGPGTFTYFLKESDTLLCGR